tara:strand:+ start:45 stop:542 length:498 start_codon:yes stop_codon:yes gene_type:complete
MEEQYTDFFGKPISKKKYEANMLRKKKLKKKRKKEEEEFKQSFFHDDGPGIQQRYINSFKKLKRDDAAGRVYVPTEKYKGKIRDINPNAKVNEDATMKELMELLKKETDKKKAKEKKETKKYGRPIKKGELAASKGSFIKKKKTGSNDYRKGGYVLFTKDNRKTK